MRQFALLKLKALFSPNGGANSPTSQMGTPYFSDSEKRLIKQKRREAQEVVKNATRERGYKVHPRILEKKKVSA